MSIRASLGHIELGPDFWGRFKEAKSSRSSKCEDFDDILEIIGSQGKFQKCLLYGVLGPVTLLVPLFMFNIVFMVYEPDHWCYVPGRDNSTELETWKNLTLPTEKGPDGKLRFSQCLMYSEDGGTVQCQNGWEYDRTDYDDTLPSQFDWVCDHGHYSTDALTLASVGNAVGTIIFGQAADKFGRKPVFFILCFVNILFRMSSLYVAHRVGLFFVHQVINALAFPLTYIVSTMLVCELSNKAIASKHRLYLPYDSSYYRAWVYSFTWMVWVMGFSLLPLLAWLTRTWFFMGWVTSAPGLVLMLYWWWVPESPRWLITRGRLEEAKVIIRNIAETNGTSDKLSPMSLDFMVNSLAEKKDENQKKPGLLSLFKKQRIAKNTILITMMWVTNNVVNYGITLNTNTLSGNQFVNFFILAITEVPSAYMGGVLANNIGRRWTQVLFYFLCTLTCTGAGLCSLMITQPYVILGFVIAAKFAVTLTFLVVYIQVTEIFPTELRSTGSGFASTVGSAMNIMAPYTVFLGKLNVAAPYIFLAGISFMGTVAAFFMPETLNRQLPESVDDANKLGKGESIWSFCPHGRGKTTDQNTKL